MSSLFKTKYLIIPLLLLLAFFCLPKPPLLEDISFSTAVYDSHYQLLRLTTSTDQKYRLYAHHNELPATMIAATLLKEDRYFYRHLGVNPWALVRAFCKTYLQRHQVVGASTITMQTARLRYHIDSHHFFGKLQQIYYAFLLERYYSKAQILEAYFNLAPYGNNIEGIKAASLIYFHQPLEALSLPQMLTLAVIPQRPLIKTPRDLTKLTEARSRLLQQWYQTHPAVKRYDALFKLPLALYTLKDLPFIAPHFVDYILKTHSPADSIQTTLDSHLQNVIAQKVQQYLKHKSNNGIKNVAVLLVDSQDMSVKAMIGSGNFFDATISGQVNGALAPRSPGSALKPFIYALAIDQGFIHPATVLKDAPMHFGAFDPENFDYHFLGPLKAKDALILSRNIPAIYLTNLLKRPSLYEFLQQAGIKLRAEKEYGLGLVLGDAEISMTQLTSLYAMLANLGWYHSLRYWQDQTLDTGLRLLSQEASFLTLDMLKDNPRPDQIMPVVDDLPIAWKTGTSSRFRDAWSVAVFGHYTLAIWVGNFDNSSNAAFVGQTAAAPLLFTLIDAMRAKQSIKAPLYDMAKLHLTRIKVCNDSGLLPTHACPGTYETWFIPGKSPIQKDTIFKEVMIDRNTGLRTCQIDPTGMKNRFSVYEFWSSDILKLFREAGISRRTPPAFDDSCGLNHLKENGLSPNIVSPRNAFIYTLTQTAPSIALEATVDADVQQLYWFAGPTFIGKTRRDQPLLWHPSHSGQYLVRVVDNLGRSDVVLVNCRLG